LLAQADEQDFLFSVSGARRFDYPFELPHLIRHVSAENIAAGIKAKEIHLSIDLELQHFLEGAVAGNVARFYYSRLTNGAALVIDNVTGEILAWVGSSDFFHAEASGQIDGVLALNQAGSSMKQFLYAMALDHGFKPTHILADIQMTFGRSEVYIPRNFNDRFNGPLLLRTALASSLNIPAVYLLYRLGVRNYTELLFLLCFYSLEHSAEDAGLGLILGNAPVSLLELVRAFSVFPRDGLYIPVTWELKTDQSEEILGVQVFSVDSSRIILSFLSDTGARVIAFGPGRNFRTSFPSIFKTGTANQFQSIVALGASQRYTAGVWMGNFTGETVIGRTGSSVPAAITRDTLVFLEERHGMHAPDFPEPENWIIQPVCAASGMEPTEACLAVVGEYVQPQDVRSPCTWHRIVNGRSEAIYPAEYQSWFISRIRQGSLFHASRALEIITPREGFVYLTSPGIGISEVPVEVIGGEGDVLRITHNGNTFHAERPFVFYLPRIPGLNILHVQSENEEAEVTFMVE
jgi:penicillin-binding protein 1C